MFCSQCGAKNEDNSRFCSSCGSVFDVKQQAQTYAQQPAAIPNMVPVMQTNYMNQPQLQPQNPKKKTGLIIEIILGLLALIIAIIAICFIVFNANTSTSDQVINDANSFSILVLPNGQSIDMKSAKLSDFENAGYTTRCDRYDTIIDANFVEKNRINSSDSFEKTDNQFHSGQGEIEFSIEFYIPENYADKNLQYRDLQIADVLIDFEDYYVTFDDGKVSDFSIFSYDAIIKAMANS